ncbi:hypothetical protein VK70_03060 [Paenibacillus durus ATCC 35681]|uniref:DUF4352 domain-containing protein n=2 Tax=Paenibacillus durus TaxID=44251 RepID=A0A0F7F765_PAEDU|nr:hypothetical protein VK70_03060 [Paenibacillus durus ATCC 35681]
MKKTILNVSTVALLLTQMFSVGGASAKAVDTAAPRVATTVTAKATAPVMTDNLFKYGLKKDVELPVTVTAGGLSYTLEKIMIYDINSKEAVTLRKTYKYGSQSGLVANPKYFVWTKITVKNNSKKTVDNISGEKWTLSFRGLYSLDPVRNFSRMEKTNDQSALNWMELKPGQQLTTYQAFMYAKDFQYFVIRLFYDGQFAEKYVVEDL